MTAQERECDEQVKLARTYQLAVMQWMLALEEELVKGKFTGEMHKAMQQFQLCISETVHNVCMHTLTAVEKRESEALLEQLVLEGSRS